MIQTLFPKRIYLATSLSGILLHSLTGMSYASAAGFRITPSLVTGHVQAGSTIEQPLSITNTSNDTEHIEVSLLPFKDDHTASGHISYALNQDQRVTNVLNNEFHVIINDTPVQSIDLLPQETKKLVVRISPPKDLPEQDQYVTLLFTLPANETPIATEANKKAATMQVNVSSGMNMILGVNDPGESNLQIGDFMLPSFKSAGPIPVRITLSNHASHFTHVTGSLRITDMFGREVVEKDFKDLILLAHTDRLVELGRSRDSQGTPISFIWKPTVMFGAYTVTITAKPDRSDKTIVVSKKVIGFPTFLVFGMVLLVALGIIIRKRMKRFSRD